MTHLVSVKYGNKEVTFPFPETYQDFQTCCAQEFGLTLEEIKGLSSCYYDEENDPVLVNCQEEYQDAGKMFDSDSINMLRFTLSGENCTNQSTLSDPSQPVSQSPSLDPMRNGVVMESYSLNGPSEKKNDFQDNIEKHKREIEARLKQHPNNSSISHNKDEELESFIQEFKDSNKEKEEKQRKEKEEEEERQRKEKEEEEERQRKEKEEEEERQRKEKEEEERQRKEKEEEERQRKEKKEKKERKKKEKEEKANKFYLKSFGATFFNKLLKIHTEKSLKKIFKKEYLKQVSLSFNLFKKAISQKIQEEKEKELEEQRRKELEEQKRKELQEQKRKELEEQKRKELEEQKRKELEEQKIKELQEQKRREQENINEEMEKSIRIERGRKVREKISKKVKNDKMKNSFRILEDFSQVVPKKKNEINFEELELQSEINEARNSLKIISQKMWSKFEKMHKQLMEETMRENEEALSSCIQNIRRTQLARESQHVNYGPMSMSISSIHSGIKCNSCGMEPIVGYRYKCSECPNYNLCERCEEKNNEVEFHQHDFIKIRNPKREPLKNNGLVYGFKWINSDRNEYVIDKFIPDFTVSLNLTNNFGLAWEKDKTKLCCDRENSALYCNDEMLPPLKPGEKTTVNIQFKFSNNLKYGNNIVTIYFTVEGKRYGEPIKINFKMVNPMMEKIEEMRREFTLSKGSFSDDEIGKYLNDAKGDKNTAFLKMIAEKN